MFHPLKAVGKGWPALALALLLIPQCFQDRAAAQAPAAGPSVDSNKSSRFDAARAYEQVKRIVAFGPRPSGSEAIKKARGYIVSELKSYGLGVTQDEFVAKTPRGEIKMANVVGELRGEKPDVVVIAGHYDTKLLPGFVGANDGGSSTAAVLETARVLAKTKPQYTLWFVFFDGEEAVVDWGAMDGKDNTYGSRRMVEKLKADGKVDRVKAMILYDMIGDKDLGIKREGDSTAWLVDLIWDAAGRLGLGKFFLADEQYLEDDHLPFLEAGIPAVDLIDFNYGPDHSYWHMNQDTLDKVSGESIKAVGDVVLESLPALFKHLSSSQPSPQKPNQGN
jgi:glutaminyl-peptide cyclotransferase